MSLIWNAKLLFPFHSALKNSAKKLLSALQSISKFFSFSSATSKKKLDHTSNPGAAPKALIKSTEKLHCLWWACASSKSLMKSQSTQYVAVLYLCIFAILLCVLSHTTAWTCHFRHRRTMQVNTTLRQV